MIDTNRERPEFSWLKPELIGQVHEYHAALREAHQLLRQVREACRKLNHPMSHQLICPYCERITEAVGE